MKAAVATALLGYWLAVPAALADEGTAPLDESRQALQRLQAEQGDKGPSARDGLNLTAPTLQSPVQVTSGYPRPTGGATAKDDRKKKAGSDRNWLINGMAKLETEAADKTLLPGEEDPAGEEATDVPESAYLLKAYDRQKKAEQIRKKESDTQRAPATDVFAPFLQSWMEGSPLDQQLAGGQVPSAVTKFLQPAGNSRAAGTPGPFVNRGPDNPAGQAGPAEAKANPYLPDPILAGDGQLAAAAAAPVEPSARPGQTLSAPVSAPAPLNLPAVVNAVSPERKAPPAPLADDKKYFPQLKRF